MSIVGYKLDWVNKRPRPREPVEVLDEGRQLLQLISQGHKPDLDGVYRSGGVFVCKTRETKYTGGYKQFYRQGANYRPAYVGKICPYPIITDIPISADLSGYGAEAYQLVRPDKAEMGLGVSLAELRDVPNMIRQTWELYNLRKWNAILHPHTLGGTSLLAQFGFMPIYSDIEGLLTKGDKIRAQAAKLIAQSGKPVRRQKEVFASHETVDIAEGQDYIPMQPALVTQCYASVPKWKITKTKQERIWISGQFRTFLGETFPTDDYKSLLAETQRRLYGLRATPKALWSGIPWTWFANWFTSYGDAVANISSEVGDRMINDYCYLMRTIEHSTKLSFSFDYYSQANEVATYEGSVSSTYTSKERITCDPFGFRAKEEELDFFKAGILASLAAGAVNK